MIERPGGRRDFLKLAAGAAVGASALPPAIAQAAGAAGRPGHRHDQGRRARRDPDAGEPLVRPLLRDAARRARLRRSARPSPCPAASRSGSSRPRTATGAVSPFHLRHRDHPRPDACTASTTAGRAATRAGSTTTPGSRPRAPLTMGYFTRADLPFYYALADAFTICDAYHCSIFGPTNPNRLFLFTGTSGLSAGDDSKHRRRQPAGRRPTRPPTRRTTRRGLQGPDLADLCRAAAGGRRLLARLSGVRQLRRQRPGLLRQLPRARRRTRRSTSAAAPGSPGSNAANAKTSEGEHLVAAVRRRRGRRPPAAGLLDRAALQALRTPRARARPTATT